MKKSSIKGLKINRYAEKCAHPLECRPNQEVIVLDREPGMRWVLASENYPLQYSSLDQKSTFWYLERDDNFKVFRLGSADVSGDKM